MKLRIRGNNIRLRLTQSEVNLLALGAEVKEYVHFGEEKLGYSLRQEQISSPEARFENQSIIVVLPSNQAKLWAESDELGISAQFGQLSLLIEKDLQCLKSRGEEDHDTFPNPKALG